MLQAQHITQQKNAQDHGVENLILQRSKKFIIAVRWDYARKVVWVNLQSC